MADNDKSAEQIEVEARRQERAVEFVRSQLRKENRWLDADTDGSI